MTLAKRKFLSQIRRKQNRKDISCLFLNSWMEGFGAAWSWVEGFGVGLKILEPGGDCWKLGGGRWKCMELDGGG